MGILSFFRNIFGNEKVRKAEDFAKATYEQAKVKAEPYIDQAEVYLASAKEKAAPILEKAEDVYEDLKEKVMDYVDEAVAKKEQTIPYIELEDDTIENSRQPEEMDNNNATNKPF